MADELAYFSFPGIDAVEGGNYTLSHGRAPGVCTLTCRPQAKPPGQYGMLTIIYGGQTLRLADCCVDQGKIVADGSGQLVSVTIYDRRWKWREPTISGRYNVYKANGELDESTRKTTRELAILCLDAMGEANYDVSVLTAGQEAIAVDWEYSNAAEALESLCEAVGCRIVLKLNGRVQIARLGVGRELPINGVSSGGQTTDLAEIPRAIRFCGGPDIYQADLELEAVAEDVAGERWKLLNEVSYTPAAGWNAADLETDLNAISDLSLREKAKASVFKCYRIVIPAAGLSIPGYEKRVFDLKHLELLSNLVTTETINGEDQPREPIVYGLWFDGRDNNENNVSSLAPCTNDLTTVYDKKAVYPYDWSVDEKSGIVRFGQPVYRESIDGNNVTTLTAQLRLRVAFHIRDDKTHARVHQEWEKITNPLVNTKPRVIRNTDLNYTAYPTYAGNFTVTALTTNYEEMTRTAQFYVEAALREYQQTNPVTYTYDGFRFDVDMDGAVQQITWSCNGSDVGQTTINRNNDTQEFLPSYKQLRFQRKVAALIKDPFARLAETADKSPPSRKQFGGGVA